MKAEATTILSIDIGTSSMKAGIIDERGKLLHWRREPLLSSTQGLAGWSAQIWIDAFETLVSALPGTGGVSGVVVSGNGPTLVPTDREGNAIADALLWIDRREERIQGEPSFYLPKAAWLKQHMGNLYERTAFFLPCPEFVCRHLTGETFAVVPSQQFVPYLWTRESITNYGLDEGKFPDMVGVGDTVGRTLGHVTEALGLPGGIPVLAGGSDFLMALLGAGAVVPGRTCDRAGTSEGINYCSAAEVRSPRLRTLPHVVPGYYNIAGILSSTGRIFEWFRRISGQNQKPYEKMLEEIRALPEDAGRPFFLPSLHVGATLDFSGAAFVGLEPEHGAPEMGRAVVESIGFSVRDLVETLSACGCSIEELRVSGGQARNPIWNQMKADMTGCRVAVPSVVDAELLGNAVAGLVGLGRFESLVEAAEALVSIHRIYEPDRERSERYTESYREFREVCEKFLDKAYRRKASRYA